jgi:hypothetical protein
LCPELLSDDIERSVGLAALNRYRIEQGLMKTLLPMNELFVGHVCAR